MNLINIAFAQDSPSGIMAAIDSFIPGGIANIFNLGLGIGAILALGTIIYAGILYSIAGDNSSKQEEAKKWIWSAVKGLALIALGVVLINIINPRATIVREIEIPELTYDVLTPLVYTSPWQPSGKEGVVTPGTGMVHPLPGARITSVFGWRIDPLGRGCREHRGIDFSTGECNNPVKATMAGTFNRARDSNPYGFGYFVSIIHADGSRSIYAHLSGDRHPNIRQGSLVSQGQVIGYVGNTGGSRGCHLHFERRNAAGIHQNINPLFGAEHIQKIQEARCGR